MINPNSRQSEYEIDSAFLNRWSPRSFLEKDIPEDVLLSILEAARWAPSAHNLQPWKFIIARNPADLNKFHSFISPGNLTWSNKAPVLALVLANTSTEQGLSRYHAFDTGAAWGYLALEATRKGLVVHAMGGFDREQARTILNIPAEYELHVVVAVGYQGEKEALPANLQDREQPSHRRPLQESLYEGCFGQQLG